MYIYYNAKTDYLEVIERKMANYGEVFKKGIFKIKSEKSDRTIGYDWKMPPRQFTKLIFFLLIQSFPFW